MKAIIISSTFLVIVAVVFVVVQTLVRRHPDRYDVIVECADGHRYSTYWIPAASYKAIRLGTTRYQRCPVGRHWARTHKVDPSSLTAAELHAARAIHDRRIALGPERPSSDHHGRGCANSAVLW